MICLAALGDGAPEGADCENAKEKTGSNTINNSKPIFFIEARVSLGINCEQQFYRPGK